MVIGVCLGADRSVTGVTYNNVAFSKIGEASNGGNFSRIQLWGLVAPDTGSHNVIVRLNAASDAVAGATSWTGINQTAPHGSFFSAEGSSVSHPSLDVSSGPGEVVVDAVCVSAEVTVASGANQTERWNAISADEYFKRGAGSSKTGATTVAMSWTKSANAGPWVIGAVSLKPVSSPPQPCSNECPSSVAKQCTDGTHYQTCGDYNSDGCLEWSSTASCPSDQACSGGVCSTSGGGETSGDDTTGGKKPGVIGSSGGTGSGKLENLKLELSVPYLVGKLKAKVEISSFAKEVELSNDKKEHSFDVKEADLTLNKSQTIILTSEKTLVRKISFTPTAIETTVSLGDLILGDLNQDNTIDSTDQLKLLDSIASQTSQGDLNLDTVINSFDWAVLLENFGKKGD
ncbi:MAG: hypothetical protein A2113_04330 [Candidatus Woykebacteria bacterium GWA1_44_8]|uniref:Dockerin domain-containing protein n=1 Tax=Candidatus Woykebacteria bacterium GWA1_44_8 TaxID=1802591 RepID=A0A1G1W125_9BACT|nr:MAG: hypothetical protein A2113_04330 [Candidatus Woykebacteria bacterium GWA1_44_8]